MARTLALRRAKWTSGELVPRSQRRDRCGASLISNWPRFPQVTLTNTQRMTRLHLRALTRPTACGPQLIPPSNYFRSAAVFLPSFRTFPETLCPTAKIRVLVHPEAVKAAVSAVPSLRSRRSEIRAIVPVDSFGHPYPGHTTHEDFSAAPILYVLLCIHDASKSRRYPMLAKGDWASDLAVNLSTRLLRCKAFPMRFKTIRRVPCRERELDVCGPRVFLAA